MGGGEAAYKYLSIEENDGLQYANMKKKAGSEYLSRLKKAFDSVHRETLWDLLHLRVIPARIIGLLTGLYSGTVSAVKCGGCVSRFFPVNTGVRQGCVLAPLLFNTCMDWVLCRNVEQSHCGAYVGNTKITDLVFADDADLC